VPPVPPVPTGAVAGQATRQPPEPPAQGAEGGAATLSPAEAAAADAQVVVRETVVQTPDQAARSARSSVVLRLGSLQLSGYEIQAELGRGGMGIVYQARQVRLNRTVALKMILSGVHTSASDRKRFQTEAEAAARLQHPHIVQVYEVGEHDGLPFLSLEFCPGGSLDKKLQGTPLPPRESAALVEKLARGVEAAHRKGIIHRDLKPHNILLAEDGTPKIADFGLAKKLDEVTQTQTGAIMGTPAYMAPEQARGRSKEIGPATDVYALGAILYQLLTGKLPFQAPTLGQTLELVATQEPVRPRRLRKTLSADLESICLKCLQKRPAERYATAQELADDLNRFLGGEAVRAEPWSWSRALRKQLARHRWRLVGIGLAAVVGAAVTFLALASRTSPTAESLAELRQAEIRREVARLLRQPPLQTRADPVPVTEVDRVSGPDHSAFEILEDARTWDLRGWQPVPPGERDRLISCATMTTRLRLQKIRPADEFTLQTRTSGAAVFIECLSHPDAYRILAQKRAAFVGRQQTRVRQCVVDVSDVPERKEFNLSFVSTVWNSLQTEEDRWVGVIGYEHSFKVSMLVLFPPDRPFKSYQLTVAPTAKADPVPYEGRKILLADEQRGYVFWEILEPKKDQVYRLHWTW
jgi:hypothetical protein